MNRSFMSNFSDLSDGGSEFEHRSSHQSLEGAFKPEPEEPIQEIIVPDAVGGGFTRKILEKTQPSQENSTSVVDTIKALVARGSRPKVSAIEETKGNGFGSWGHE